MKRQFFKGRIIFLFLAVFLLSGCRKGSTPAQKNASYPRGYNFREVPKPLSGINLRYPLIDKAVPVCGKFFKDARFSARITRVTQKKSVRHEYARYDPFNVDQSMIILHFPSNGEYKIFRTRSIPYEQKANLVRTIELEEPRWDPEDSSLIWGIQEFRLLAVSAKTGKTKIIKDFSQGSKIGSTIKSESDLYRITMKNEGESSRDKRFWAFALQGSKDDYRLRYIFTWDRQQDKVLGIYKIPPQEGEIDWVGMSAKGNWILIGGDSNNGGKLAGLTMANKELTQFHRLDYATAHADVGLGSQGNEVIVMQNVQTDYIDLIPIDLKTKAILKSGGSYEHTNRTPLMRLYYNSESPRGLNSGVHISCNFPGYCVVSTNIEPGLREQNWLDRTITLVKLDRNSPRVFYLAKVYGTTKEYWEETHAAITGDGSKVIWASNWSQNIGKEQVFLLQLDMPDNWTKLTD